MKMDTGTNTAKFITVLYWETNLIMIDIGTKKPLEVSTEGDAGLYIMVPVKQVGDVRSLLDAEKIPYWVDEYAISIDGRPEVTVVNLRHGSDAAAVRNILDNAP